MLPERRSVIPPRMPHGMTGGIVARVLWALILALALFAVQTQAQAHLVGHAGEMLRGESASSAAGQTEHDHDHIAACLDCLALTGVDLPLGGHSPADLRQTAALPLPDAAPLPSPDAPPPRPRCRAPPRPSLFFPLA